MASYLQVENISKSYGDKVLFDAISFNINQGDKIALIAPNGSGKTSLLNVLSGKDHSDSGGRITFLTDISIAYLEQDTAFDPQHTVYEEVFRRCTLMHRIVTEYEAALAAHDPKRLERAITDMDRTDGWNWDQRIRQMLTTLKIPDPDRPMRLLSGGEAKRVAIAILLLQEADFLVMDEPTNHLDMEIIEYLEDTLKKSRRTLFVVTHDRYFLDRVCNTVFELDHGKLYTYKGNYASFLEKREERLANFAAETDKARNLLRRELEWIHSTPCARTGKAKYRIDAFYELQDRANVVVDNRKLDLNIHASRLGKKIINCKQLGFSFPDRCMLHDFTYNFARYEKIGVIGENGVGKSTFLRLLMGEITPTQGTLERGESLVIGYYRQEGLDIKPGSTLLDVVDDSALLSRFLFPPSTHNTKVDRLSGGERRRLYLLTILKQNPNFLILDEPTNDLDIMTLNVLEDYLSEFKGCLLIVSHDRYFLDKLADHIFVFMGDGHVKDYVGKCSEYRQYVRDTRPQATSAPKSATPSAPQSAPAEASSQSAPKKKRSYKDQKRLEALEAQVAALEEEKALLEASLSSGTLPLEDLTNKSVRIGKIIVDLDNCYNELLSLYTD